MLLDELLQGMELFVAAGLNSFASDWAEMDALRDREVIVSGNDPVL